MEQPMQQPAQGIGKFVAVVLVVMILTAVVAVLMPSLGAARRAAIRSSMRESSSWNLSSEADMGPPRAAGNNSSGAAALPAALIRSLEAHIELRPTLTLGMASQESIYVVKVAATLQATRANHDAADCEIVLPLPPQIISLSDLTFKVDNVASEEVARRDAKLVWHGKLGADEPSKVEVTYTAVGKGIYTLEIPEGRILDSYHIDLAALGSDVRMLQLSLQPTKLDRQFNQTVYTWDYKRLMFGRPIALDVLGVAAEDRLGELGWLGPVSVVFFGVMLALVAQAFRPEKLDHWMLLLVVGVFTSVYPLMYFAQTEFDSLGAAVLISAVLVVGIIGIRAVMLFGWKLGVAGVIVPAAVILAITLAAAIYPRSQGLLLTGQTIAFFVVATTLAPRIKKTLVTVKGAAATAASRPPLPHVPPMAPFPPALPRADGGAAK